MAHGGLVIDHRDFRETDDGTDGSGLEITGVSIVGEVNLQGAYPDQADEDANGVGDVQNEGNAMLWGDVNCDGLINVMDALSIILYGADYPYSQTEPCPLIGEEVHVSGFN